jgi:DNA-binding response OmpR family regulator
MDHTLLSAKSILVVEDEPLLCLDIARHLEDAGAKVFAASNLDKALKVVEASPLSAGVLDFDLGNGDSSAVCWKLVDRGIPFIFYTGRPYSALKQWPSARVILKPASEYLIGAVAALFTQT